MFKEVLPLRTCPQRAKSVPPRELLAEMAPQDGGTTRTASRTRPLMRKKPICNANPASGRLPSLLDHLPFGRREREERSISKAVSSRGSASNRKKRLATVHCTLLDGSNSFSEIRSSK